MSDLTFPNQFHDLEGVVNQTLAERAAAVNQRSAPAEPPVPSTGDPEASTPSMEPGDGAGETPESE